MHDSYTCMYSNTPLPSVPEGGRINHFECNIIRLEKHDISQNLHLVHLKGMDLPGHSDLYIGKAGRDFCQQWHFHMWGQSHPGIGDGDGWCGDCVDVDTQAFDTQLIHSWYTVDTQAVDWYVAPLLNPDGYEYSHTNDRMWRKNRFLKRKQTKPIFPIFQIIFSIICEKGIEI